MRMLFTREERHYGAIVEVGKYKCLVKTYHRLLRHQLAESNNNAELTVYFFYKKEDKCCLNEGFLSTVTRKISTESFTE